MRMIFLPERLRGRGLLPLAAWMGAAPAPAAEVL